MSIEAKILKWALGKNTGASSKCMAAHLTGNESSGDYPHDAGDFGRCVGLLNAVLELRDTLPKMATLNSYWAALVKEWDYIESLNGDYSKQTSAINKVIRPIESKDNGVIHMKGATIRLGDIK